MGTTPRLGDALRLSQRAAAFDSQREASVRSADRHAPNHIARTGKARRITSPGRSRSGRQAAAADAPATTSASAPRPRCFTRSRSSVTLQGSIHRLSPHRDIPAPAPDDSRAHASHTERAVSRFESATVHSYRSTIAVRTQSGNRAQPSTITRGTLQRAVSRQQRRTVSDFQWNARQASIRYAVPKA